MEIEAQHGNTYVVDAEDPAEMARLMNLDLMLTKAMGGPLSGVPALPEGGKVLDLACGPGGWVLDVAFACPDCEVAGVDISTIMVPYANARARTQHLTNASFGIMDITKPLDFSDNTFDLVNARLLVGVLQRAHWQPFFDECTRILKPGGLLRLTEPIEPVGITSSKSYQTLCRLIMQIFWRLGYGFSADGYSLGLTTTLPCMLRRMGYQNMRSIGHLLEFSADCEAWQGMYDNMRVSQSQIDLFFGKQDMIPMKEIMRLYNQACIDWHSPDFCGMLHFATILGEKPLQC